MEVNRFLLIILDGWGIGDMTKSDVIYNTPTPNFDRFIDKYPHSKLMTCGEDVGLPDGQMGNSEVGHLNIGAGRIIYLDLVKINKIFPVHASMVLLRSMMEKEQNKILETAHFLKNAGCLSLRFWMYRPMGFNPQLNEIMVDTDPAYVEFRQQMEKALPGFCLWPAAVQSGGKIKKLCPQLWQRVGCDMFGNMAICCGTDTLLSGPNSNLFNAAPDAVFNNPALVAMRKQLLDPDAEPPAVCKNCNLLSEPGW